ncbi:MAG: hypothetical protein AAFV28_10555 [Cyanobacteria bacterium J06635_13]
MGKRTKKLDQKSQFQQPDRCQQIDLSNTPLILIRLFHHHNFYPLHGNIRGGHILIEVFFGVDWLV